MCPNKQGLIIALLQTCIYIAKKLELEPTLYLKPNNYISLDPPNC